MWWICSLKAENSLAIKSQKEADMLLATFLLPTQQNNFYLILTGLLLPSKLYKEYDEQWIFDLQSIPR